MNKKKHKNLFHISWLFVLLISLLLSACGGVPNVDWELSISGDVTHPITYTYDDLANMPQVDLSEVLMEKSRGEDEVLSFSGVELSVLLADTGASEIFSTITAKAADGYAVEISKDEIVDGMVALKQAGEWIINIDPDAGPIRLVFPSTPANRWVFQVTEIIVNP